MTLKEFLEKHPRGTKRRKAIISLAKSVGVQETTVRQWLSGWRNTSPKHAIAIQKATDGEVPASVVSPQIYAGLGKLPFEQTVYRQLYKDLLKENKYLKKQTDKIKAILEEIKNNT